MQFKLVVTQLVGLNFNLIYGATRTCENCSIGPRSERQQRRQTRFDFTYLNRQLLFLLKEGTLFSVSYCILKYNCVICVQYCLEYQCMAGFYFVGFLMGPPGLFYRLFSVFSNKHNDFTTIDKKNPFIIRYWDSNPQPLDVSLLL